MYRRVSNQLGQSVLEYVVVLALIAIIATTALGGLGRRSQVLLTQAHNALEESSIAAASGASKASGKGNRGRGASHRSATADEHAH